MDPASPNPRPVSQSAPFLGTRPRPVTLADIIDDLLWVKLLRAPAMALRPQRLILCLFGALLIFACLNLPSVWYTDHPPYETLIDLERAASRDLVDALRRMHSGDVVAAIWKMVYSSPRAIIRETPIAAGIMFIPTVLIFAIVGCAVSRMVACEFSQGVRISWNRALAFSFRKLFSTVGALLTPICIVGILAFIIALLGWTLGVPVLNVLGAVLYGVSIVFAAFAVIVIGAYLLGWPMLIPAVACEGTDSIDATQRTLAYVMGRPLQLLLYSLLLFIQAVVAALLFAVIVAGIEGFIAHASSLFAGDAAKAVASLQTSDLGPSFRIAGWIISFWHKALGVLLGAFLLCLHFAGSTIRYLLLRRINDGQEIDELWMPRMIPGTAAPVDPEDADDDD